MSGSVRVISKRAGGVRADSDECVLDGDRKSPLLGNRHVLRDHRDADLRAKVIHAHLVQDLEPDILRGGPIYRELQRVAQLVSSGRRIAFACWCAPLPCHCDQYVEVVQMLVAGQDVPAAVRARVEARRLCPSGEVEEGDQFNFGF